MLKTPEIRGRDAQNEKGALRRLESRISGRAHENIRRKRQQISAWDIKTLLRDQHNEWAIKKNLIIEA